MNINRFNKPNSMPGSQRGLSLIGFILLLSTLLFVAYIGMKIAPIYFDYYSVTAAMKGVQAEPGIGRKSPREIKDLMFRRLYVSYVEGIEEKHIKVTRKGGVFLQVKYEVRKNVLGNLDVIVSFDKSVELSH